MASPTADRTVIVAIVGVIGSILVAWITSTAKINSVKEGPEGASGLAGPAGERGATGPQGPPGPAGPRGEALSCRVQTAQAAGVACAPGESVVGGGCTCPGGILRSSYPSGNTWQCDYKDCQASSFVICCR